MVMIRMIMTRMTIGHCRVFDETTKLKANVSLVLAYFPHTFGYPLQTAASEMFFSKSGEGLSLSLIAFGFGFSKCHSDLMSSSNLIMQMFQVLANYFFRLSTSDTGQGTMLNFEQVFIQVITMVVIMIMEILMLVMIIATVMLVMMMMMIIMAMVISMMMITMMAGPCCAGVVGVKIIHYCLFIALLVEFCNLCCFYIFCCLFFSLFSF